MATAPSPDDDLAAIIRRALLPQRFPFRRDADLHAGLAPFEGHVFFHDHHWLGRTLLAVAAVRVAGDGLDGALAAASFRQLLRAALAVERDPGAALATCARVLPALDAAAAVVCLDVSDGALASAATGRAGVSVLPRGGGGPLPPGSIVWLSAGDVPPPAADGVPVEGLGALVGPALEHAGGGCAAAVLFKRAARSVDAATFVVPNDSAAIPAFLREVQEFLDARSVAGDDAAGVDVALDELLTNTISYAFADGGAHEIVATLALEKGQLVIELRDDGAPFDPLGVPPPDLSGDIDERDVGGLGMHFVRGVMDEIAYRRSGGWNVLTLHKRLARAERPQEARP